MTTARHTIPRLFDGAWDSVIICTYGAALDFYERDLARQIERARNRVILADGGQVTAWLASAENRAHLRQVNRTYVLAPLQSTHAAHAKLILLLNQDSGRLAVGSGNLGMTGYASQGECFTTYSWSDEETDHLGAFVAARMFVDRLIDLRLVDRVVQPRVRQAWQDAPWIYASPADGPFTVRHNLDRPLLDQLLEEVGDRHVDELVVHAPFFDTQCRALAELLARTKPSKLELLLQERTASVDPTRLQRVLGKAACEVEVRSVEAEDRGTFLHAKFIVSRCGDEAFCLQGSANLSTPALLYAYPRGNIEIANLLTGERSAFDHLISDLRLSQEPRRIADLGLGLLPDDDEAGGDELGRSVSELVWRPPRLTGEFDGAVSTPPTLIIGEDVVDEVSWKLHEVEDDRTPFTATIGEQGSALLTRVEAVSFVFDSGETSAPSFPYHLNALIALASAQGRTDLLKHAGDFDIDDEELEQLLLQLDEVLVVDGRSLWRVLRRESAAPDEGDDTARIAYEDLDWDAIQSHPKLAQYRSWSYSSPEPTGLGILLTSIARRFKEEVDRKRTGGLTRPLDTDDLPDDHSFDTADPEDEEAAEAEAEVAERRRLSARVRAKRQFQAFIKRFVKGLSDEQFVEHVGSSVVLPSYVVFNHLCWKLAQLELADPLSIVTAQARLWHFFWGGTDDPGYFKSLSPLEQEAALDILDRHHAEAVLLCSVFKAYDDAWNFGTNADVVSVREAWRTILQHPLWQPSAEAVADAATALEPLCESAEELVGYLEGLASFVTESEPLRRVEQILGAGSRSVRVIEVRVNRGPLGERNVQAFVIDDPASNLLPDQAVRVMGELRDLVDETHRDYIRIEHPPSNVIAFADYLTDLYVYADRDSGDIVDLDRPESSPPPWRGGMDELIELAG